MSWDVFIFNAPADATSVDDVADDFNPPALGAATEIRARLQANLPDLDLSDPTWGNLDGPNWSIELNMGSDDPVDSIMLHVRGGGDEVLVIVTLIAAVSGGRALDVSTGSFLTGQQADADGWQGFQRYRDRVLRGDP